jgi:Xaa-Pro aminopeptidase
MRIVHPELRIFQSEYTSRRERFRENLQSLGLKSMLFKNNGFITYLTGLDCSPTERPIGPILPVDGEPAIITTRIEEAHIRQ